MWNDLLAALALMLVIEGVLPFLNPEGLKMTLARMIQMDNRSIRIMGLLSMLAGVGLLYIVR